MEFGSHSLGFRIWLRSRHGTVLKGRQIRERARGRTRCRFSAPSRKTPGSNEPRGSSVASCARGVPGTGADIPRAVRRLLMSFNPTTLLDFIIGYEESC